MPPSSQDDAAEIRRLQTRVHTLERRLRSLQDAEDRRREAERHLQASEEKYRAIFEHTGAATILIEADTTIAAANGQLETMSGYHRRDLEGKVSWTVLIADEDRERMLGYHRLRRRHPELVPRNYECRIRVSNGEIRPCFMTVGMIPGTNRSVASIIDISDLRRLEQRIAEIGDAERRRIGQELHDDLGSHLVGVEAMCTLLARRLEREGHAGAGAAGEIASLIRDATAKTRQLARGLIPVDLESFGLGMAIEKLAARVSAGFGITCRFEGEAGVEIGDNTVSTHLYRIVQESVNNAVHHGRATEITIALRPMAEVIELCITDNGCGMPAPAVAGEGVGLAIMRHRAHMIGATLDVISTPGKGAAIRCRIHRKYLS
jgi:PAS domain S-box-containing protein